MSEKGFCDFVFAIQNVLYVSPQGVMEYVPLCLSIDLEGHLDSATVLLRAIQLRKALCLKMYFFCLQYYILIPSYIALLFENVEVPIP